MFSPTASFPLFLLLLVLVLPPILCMNTLDECRDSRDCDGLLDCVPFIRGTIGSSSGCPFNVPTCRCVPFFDFSPCSSRLDCPTNETCVIYTPGSSGPLAALNIRADFDSPFCASADAEQQFTDIEIFPTNPDSAPTGNRSVIDDTTPFATTGGLTLDTCRHFDDCFEFPTTSNRCTALHRGALGVQCDGNFANCRCAPSSGVFRICNTDIDCVVGEICAKYVPGSNGFLARWTDDFDFNSTFCVSAKAEATLADLELMSVPAGEEPTGNQTVVDVTTPIFNERRDRLAFEECKDSQDCVDSADFRSCLAFSEEDIGDVCFSDDCRCLPYIDEALVCRDREDCILGEACVMYTGPRNGLFAEIRFLDFTQPFCMSARAVGTFEEIEFVGGDPQGVSETPTPGVSETPTPGVSETPTPGVSETPTPGVSETPTPEGEAQDSLEDQPSVSEEASVSSEVCIDARHVSHLGRGELLYGQDVTAQVLCDSRGSCATAGHMVVFEGVAMRMRAYCGIVGCAEEVRKVNSPRYRRKLRVKSMTEGLEFTAFAARYETLIEEILLAMMVKLGL